MIRNSLLKLALLAGLLLVCFSLQASSPSAPAPALLTAPPAPLCDATSRSLEDAGWMEIANLVEKRQCYNDDQCKKVCPCLPQCVDGYCANCLWCPPDS